MKSDQEMIDWVYSKETSYWLKVTDFIDKNHLFDGTRDGLVARQEMQALARTLNIGSNKRKPDAKDCKLIVDRLIPKLESVGFRW